MPTEVCTLHTVGIDPSAHWALSRFLRGERLYWSEGAENPANDVNERSSLILRPKLLSAVDADSFITLQTFLLIAESVAIYGVAVTPHRR